jgi:hypothetical protein
VVFSNSPIKFDYRQYSCELRQYNRNFANKVVNSANIFIFSPISSVSRQNDVQHTAGMDADKASSRSKSKNHAICFFSIKIFAKIILILLVLFFHLKILFIGSGLLPLFHKYGGRFSLHRIVLAFLQLTVLVIFPSALIICIAAGPSITHL